MGWFWGSSEPSIDTKSTQSDRSSPALQPLSSNTSANQSNAPLTKPESREQRADRELEAFLSSLEGTGNTQSTVGERTAKATDFSPEPVSAPPAHSRDASDISPKALYPRTMSCRQAFDQAFYCQSLGGKFNDIYRYGALQSCSENWDAFWFCMRVKGYPDQEKQVKISDFYEAREKRKIAAVGSSEDVWEIRTTPVEKAFWRDPDRAEEAEGLGGKVNG